MLHDDTYKCAVRVTGKALEPCACLPERCCAVDVPIIGFDVGARELRSYCIEDHGRGPGQSALLKISSSEGSRFCAGDLRPWKLGQEGSLGV